MILESDGALYRRKPLNPLYVLSLLQIAYGGLLISVQVLPKMYTNFCHHSCCNIDSSSLQTTAGVVFLLAGTVLILTIKPNQKTKCWMVFASFFVFGVHGALTTHSSFMSYHTKNQLDCDISSFLFICVGIGSLFIASASIIAAVFFCFPYDAGSNCPIDLSRFHVVSELPVNQHHPQQQSFVDGHRANAV